jgi:ketosteroid isomerase-like protein
MPFMPDLLDEANLGAQATSEDCSGARAILWEQVGDEPPPAVAATRFSIADAAAVCDWEALRALMADDFSYSFGFEPNADGAISYWQDAEAAGEPIMRTLAETLSQFTTESEGHYQLGDPSEPLGYRVVIREDGAWTAFIAGD